MRIAVAGATGNIGSRTVAVLEQAGHEVARISRSLGVDLVTGSGLDAALTGVDAVLDATSFEAADRDDAVAIFGASTRNLLAAEQRAGVRHHVLLSIVGIDRIEGGNAHYAGKREQERLVAEGPVPWTIVPVTQFHDFAATVTGWTEHDGVAEIPPPAGPADRTRRRGRHPRRNHDERTTRTLPRRRRPGAAGPGGHGPPHQRRARARGQARADVGVPAGAGDGRRRTPARRRRPHRGHHIRRVAHARALASPCAPDRPA